MQTLSYGFKLPQSGDTGATLWTALQGDITQLNAHDHNGVNSKKIPPTSFATVIDDILAANWVAVGGKAGHFKQTMTIPTGLTFDDYVISFRDSVGIIYPTVVRLTNTTYDIYTIDNSQALTAVYGV